MDPEEEQDLDVQVDEQQQDAASPEDVQSEPVAGQVQYDAQGQPTTYADGSPLERDAYGNVIYDDEPAIEAPEPAAPAPFSTPTSAAPNVALSPILSDDEQAQLASLGITPEAQTAITLIASRIAARSEQAMIAGSGNLAMLQSEAPELFNVVGNRVAAQMANLTPEVRARPDAASLAVQMAMQEEVRTTGNTIFQVMDRWQTLRQKGKAPALRPAPAPTPARARAPGASPNSAPRPTHNQQARVRAPRVGVGLNLTPEEQRQLAADPSIMGNRR